MVSCAPTSQLTTFPSGYFIHKILNYSKFKVQKYKIYRKIHIFAWLKKKNGEYRFSGLRIYAKQILFMNFHCT